MNFLESEPESAQFFFSVIRDGESPENNSTFFLLLYGDSSLKEDAVANALGAITLKIFEVKN